MASRYVHSPIEESAHSMMPGIAMNLKHLMLEDFAASSKVSFDMEFYIGLLRATTQTVTLKMAEIERTRRV